MSDDEQANPRVPGAGRRPRLHLIYFSLAVFDLITVSMSLYLIDRIMNSYRNSVETNQVWALRLSDCAELSRLAAAVNAPGNDVFTSKDVEREAARLRQAKQRFDARAAAVRQDLAKAVPPSRGVVVAGMCDMIEQSMDLMVNEAQLIFSGFENHRPDQAGVHMTAMDQQYAGVHGALNALGDEVRDIQKSQLEGQAAGANAWRKSELAIAGLILCMVVAVTLYGLHLTQQMKLTAAVTARTLAALEQSEAQLRAVFSAALDPIITADVHGVVQAASDSIREVLGWDASELVGRSVAVLIPEDQRSAHEAALTGRGSLKALPVVGVKRELEGLHRDGRRVPLEVSVSSVSLSGSEAPLFIGVIHDITERKRASDELAGHRDRLEELVEERTAELEASHERLRLSERLASIGTLAAGLGHDMNNVLFPVRCRLEALDAGDLPAVVQEHLAAVRHSMTYMQQLSDGLRLLALDPTEQRQTPQRTDLARWWPEVRPLFGTVLGKEARLEGQFSGDLPAIMVAPHRFTQAVFNLVTNARQALLDGGTVTVTAAPLEDRRFVRITVGDNGCGMTPEVARSALVPFYTTRKRQVSTGLGLALVQGVAASAGGTVEIESEPQRGTKVHMILPAVEEKRNTDRQDRDAGALASVSVQDPRRSALLASLLKSAGYEVRELQATCPEACDLWAVDADRTTIEGVQEFLASHAGRQAIVFDGDPETWGHLDVLRACSSDGFQQLRELVSLAAAGRVKSS